MLREFLKPPFSRSHFFPRISPKHLEKLPLSVSISWDGKGYVGIMLLFPINTIVVRVLFEFLFIISAVNISNRCLSFAKSIKLFPSATGNFWGGIFSLFYCYFPGGLAYLASRRGSRESALSGVSHASNEDIGPLNFIASARGRQRRTSNFLELPGKTVNNWCSLRLDPTILH